MARPRIATNVHELRGRFKKNPDRGRERAQEPVPKAGIGPAPAHLSDAEREIWDEIVGLIAPGVLGDSDRLYLETVAQLVALKRKVGVEAMEAAKLGRLEMMLAKLGMSPADRSRVKAPPSAPKNDFDDI